MWLSLFTGIYAQSLNEFLVLAAGPPLNGSLCEWIQQHGVNALEHFYSVEARYNSDKTIAQFAFEHSKSSRIVRKSDRSVFAIGNQVTELAYALPKAFPELDFEWSCAPSVYLLPHGVNVFAWLHESELKLSSYNTLDASEIWLEEDGSQQKGCTVRDSFFQLAADSMNAIRSELENGFTLSFVLSQDGLQFIGKRNGEVQELFDCEGIPSLRRLSNLESFGRKNGAMHIYLQQELWFYSPYECEGLHVHDIARERAVTLHSVQWTAIEEIRLLRSNGGHFSQMPWSIRVAIDNRSNQRRLLTLVVASRIAVTPWLDRCKNEFPEQAEEFDEIDRFVGDVEQTMHDQLELFDRKERCKYRAFIHSWKRDGRRAVDVFRFAHHFKQLLQKVHKQFAGEKIESEESE
jgi:hypothetical protein